MAIAVTFLLTQGVFSALSSAEIELLGDETSYVKMKLAMMGIEADRDAMLAALSFLDRKF
jgi:hypothetical protein